MPDVRADLDQLAREDAVVAPLAALQAVALARSEEPGWDVGLPALGQNRLEDGAPLLHALTVAVEPRRQRLLLTDLADALAEADHRGGGSFGALLASRSLDPLALLAASLTQDTASIETMAAAASVEPGILAVLGHAATLPLLLASGRRAEPLVRTARWSLGSCPVCAAWPTLAEVRGLARELVLRCGRCASAWPGETGRCPFCDTHDHERQMYLAAEQERESRRAVVCDACHGYLKTMTTLGALGPAELLVRDLQSLELDVVALDQGYQRPDGLGFALSVTVVPAPDLAADGSHQDGRARSGWRRWWT